MGEAGAGLYVLDGQGGADRPNPLSLSGLAGHLPVAVYPGTHREHSESLTPGSVAGWLGAAAGEDLASAENRGGVGRQPSLKSQVPVGSAIGALAFTVDGTEYAGVGSSFVISWGIRDFCSVVGPPGAGDL
jgi:hypothetical protein